MARNIIKYPSIEHVNLNSTRVWKGEDPETANNHRFYLEEKVDGSQLSFCVETSNDEQQIPTVEFFNKGKQIQKSNKTFYKAIAMVETLAPRLDPTFVYHGEAVCNKQHNTAVYSRCPKYYFILYDLTLKSNGTYLDPDAKKKEAERVGFETVPILYYNEDPDVSPYSKCSEILADADAGKIESVLGGKIEGIVLKHHAFVKQGKIISTKQKLVRDEFKESNSSKKPKRKKLDPAEFLAELGSCYATRPRYFKAYQHLRDHELLQNKPNDIFKIREELDRDFEKEYLEEIKNYLWVEFRSTILDKAREGVDDWYKELKEQQAMRNAED